MREERWRLLALALYRSSRQSDALAALRRARSLLLEELGVDPGPDLQQLEAAVLAQSEDLLPRPARRRVPVPGRAVPSAVRAASSSPHPTTWSTASASSTSCASAWPAHSAGRAGWRWSPGPPASGRAGCSPRLGTRAEQGALALTARGSQMEKEYAFGAVRQLFEPLLAKHESAEALFTGSARSAASVFDVGAADLGATDGSLAVLHGLYWLTVNLAAGRPVWSRWTTCSGATPARCASWPTSPTASKDCPCW